MRVYVVLCVGLTFAEPLVLTEPTPLSIEQELALLQFHVRVVDCGGTTVEGEPENMQTGFSNTVVVVTGAGDVVPPGPVAFKVYVVVLYGFTVAEPEPVDGSMEQLTLLPLLAEIEQEFALEQFQDRVDWLPSTIWEGEEVKLEHEGGGQAGALQLCEADPTQSTPPLAGAGLVQLLVCVPVVPQAVALQELQLLHPPFTGVGGGGVDGVVAAGGVKLDAGPMPCTLMPPLQPPLAPTNPAA